VGDQPVLTHDELIIRAERWLRSSKKCGVVLTELVTSSPETPDAIGWQYGGRWSILIECKTSICDFYADSKKQGRSLLRSAGMGRERYYMAPMGVLTKEVVKRNRPGWGLLEVKGRRVYLVLQAIPFSHESRMKEAPLLYSCVWRIQHGVGVGALKRQKG
jgi:hypothetical protein